MILVVLLYVTIEHRHTIHGVGIYQDHAQDSGVQHLLPPRLNGACTTHYLVLVNFSIVCPRHATPAISLLLNPSLTANLRPSRIGAISAISSQRGVSITFSAIFYKFAVISRICWILSRLVVLPPRHPLSNWWGSSQWPAFLRSRRWGTTALWLFFRAVLMISLYWCISLSPDRLPQQSISW